MSKKLRIRNPFYFVGGNVSDVIKVSCHRCSKEFFVYRVNLRVTNYCWRCK